MRRTVAARTALDRVEGAHERLGDPVGVVWPLPLAGAVAAAVGVGELAVRALPGRLDDRLDVVRGQARVRREEQGGHARDVGRGHARAHLARVAAAGPVGVDLGARCGHVDRRAEVAVLGERVVAEQEDEPAAAQSAGLAVEVGQRRDRDHLGECGRDERRGIDRRVARRGDEGDPGRVGVADGLSDSAVGAGPDRSDVAEAHVRDAHVVRRVAVGRQAGQVVDRADQIRPFTGTLVVEHLERHEPRLGGHADDAQPVRGRGDDPGDVRAVAVAVLRRTGRHAVAAERGVEVRDEVGMGEIDPGVQDRDLDAGPGEPLARRAVVGRVVGPDPGNAGRDPVGHEVDGPVRHDRPNGRVEPKCGGGPDRAPEDEPVEGVAEGSARVTASRPRQRARARDRAPARLEGDDPALRRRGAGGGTGPCVRGAGGPRHVAGQQRDQEHRDHDADPQRSATQTTHRDPGIQAASGFGPGECRPPMGARQQRKVARRAFVLRTGPVRRSAMPAVPGPCDEERRSRPERPALQTAATGRTCPHGREPPWFPGGPWVGGWWPDDRPIVIAVPLAGRTRASVGGRGDASETRVASGARRRR